MRSDPQTGEGPAGHLGPSMHEGQEATDRLPALSVIVPTSRPAPWMEPLLASLAQQRLEGEMEVIIVDNSPTGALGDSVATVSARTPLTLRYVHEPRTGLHWARHAGALAARAQILAYLDDDVIVRDRWAAALAAPFSEPSVAIVGGRVVPRWEAEPPRWLSQFPDSYLSLLDRGAEPCDFEYPDGAYGCNMAVRRTLLFRVGGFNPDLFSDRRQFWRQGDGETGLHRKIEALGDRARYAPDAVVEHRIPAARLTTRAFVHRGAYVGLNWSFTEVRNAKGRRRWALSLLAGSARAVTQIGRAVARTLLGRRGWRRNLSDAVLWLTFLVHHLKVLVSPALRSFVWQDSYLSNGQGREAE